MSRTALAFMDFSGRRKSPKQHLAGFFSESNLFFTIALIDHNG